MKKFLIIISILLLISCAAPKNQEKYDFASDDRYPPGKTDADWEKEEMECRNMSGKITGFLGVTIFGLANNIGEVNEKYDKCMREKGWYK